MIATRRWLAAVSCGWLLALQACGAAAKPKPKDATEDMVVGSTDLGNINPPATTKTTAQKGQSRAPTLREARVINELMGSAERIRGLSFARPVPVQVQDRQRITAYVESQIEEDELERARIVYTALGLLAPTLDVRALLLRLMGEQVVGYYDSDAKQLCVRDDVMRNFAKQSEGDEGEDLTEARIVLVHELVHALQDQNLDLSAQIAKKRDTDADNAFHALVEGDATLAMIGYALEGEHIPLHKLTGNPAQVRSFSDVVSRSPLAGTELEQAPAIVRVPLLSAYVDGLSFCASLHGAAGWPGVNRAFAAPPISTEQVLHPERFAHGDVPMKVTLPVLPALAAAGYKEVREDTLGELEMGVYFSQSGNNDAARAAADGWNGDRVRVYQAPNMPPAVVWVTVWDSEHDAEQAAASAEQVQAKAAPTVRARSEVARSGRSVLILRDLPDALRGQVKASFSEAGLGSVLVTPPALH